MIAAGQEVVGTALLAGLLILRVGLAVYALVSGVLTRHRNAGPSEPERRPGTAGPGARKAAPRAHRRR